MEGRRDSGKGGKDKVQRIRRGACFAWDDGNSSLSYCQFEHVCSKCFGGHRRDVSDIERGLVYA